MGYKVEGTSTTMMGGETREGAVHQEREEGVINSAGGEFLLNTYK